MEEGTEKVTMLPSVSSKPSKETTIKRCLYVLSDIRFYTASLTLTMFSFGLAWGYFLSSITTIERRFGFGSTETGLILGCYEMGHLSIALFISHFGNRTHIPRIMFISFFILGSCYTVLSLPHFFLGPLTMGIDSATGNSSVFDTIGELCVPSSDLVKPDPLMSDSQCSNSNGAPAGPTNYALPAIIFIIMGMAGTPMSCLAVAYVDNNADPVKSPLYVGICFSALSLGPTVGFFLGAWCLQMFEDLTEPPITPDHPRWIGAWWLGLLIAGSLQIITSLPMLLVSRKLQQEKALSIIGEEKKSEVEPYTCQGLLASVGRILKNPVFICLTLSGTCGIYIFAGFFSFFPKYFETQYRIPAWKANAIAGLVSGFAAGVGSIVGGGIVTRFRLGFRATLRMCMISVSVAVVAMLTGMFMGCDNIPLVTSNSTVTDTTFTACLMSCDCSEEEFSPVCDPSSGLSYFSPCIAGCKSHEISETTGLQIFTDCSCLESRNATFGLCSQSCPVLVPYSVIFVIFTFAQSLVSAPGVILTMRCVKKSDKALAMGIAGCILSLLGWVVAPVVYGIGIDSACALWQSTCGSTATGSCWLYRSNDYRIKFHGFTLVFTVGLLIFFFMAYKFSKGKNFDEVEGEISPDNQNPQSLQFTMADSGSMTQEDGVLEDIPLRNINANDMNGT